MNIQGISAKDPISLAAASGSQDVDRDAFMQLLVTQLENQDPLNPAANEDFIAQLATFSSLEELEQMNGNLSEMIALNQSNALLSQLTESSALIGKTVSWTDPATGAPNSGEVDSVRVEDGIALLQIGDKQVPIGAVNMISEGSLSAFLADDETNGDETESEA